MTALRHPADGRIHFSELKVHQKSAAHVAHAIRHARELTRPMIVGSIADSIVFGNKGYACYPGKVRNGKEWEAFRAEHTGKVLCIQSELDEARGAAEAVLADPRARRRLEGCDYQRVMHWDAYGLPCAAGVAGERGGFDAISEREGFISDLKITASTNPAEFTRHALKMYWHAQAAWYLDGAAALGLDAREFYLIGCEPSPPHVVTVLRLTPKLIAWGRRSLVTWTEMHRQCEESGSWDGYSVSEVEFDVPEWAEVA